MSQVWTSLRSDHYLGLVPWAWVQLESAEAPGPFPFIGGVAPEVVASLHEAHQLLLSSVETAISDVFSRRASLDDPTLRVRLEDAYAELVGSRPHLSTHIKCGRGQDGVFRWEFPLDPTKSETVTNAGLSVFNSVARQMVPLRFERPIGPAVGKFIGFLDGTHRVSEIRTVATASGREMERHLTGLLELLQKHECLVSSERSSVRDCWLAETHDQDMVHLGHAALLYRQREQFFLFDPWLMPWFAESPVPSLWGSLLPRPAAIFLTHDHDDHVDPRTLLHMPKDIPIIVPSRRNRRALYYDYLSLFRELGFAQVIELAHGETWTFEGGAVVSVPFFGEDPCDIEMPRNCYLVADRGRNTLVHADSGPTNSGKSVVQEGVIDNLVRQYGPIATVLASQQQLLEVRTYAAHAALSAPGRWLDVGENGYLTNGYLAELAAAAKARLFVSYATGGADWYPDHLSFMFSKRNPARTALLTANWERPEELKAKLAPLGCAYHYSHALDVFRPTADGGTAAVSAAEKINPLQLYRLDHGAPPFLRARDKV
ncbi:MAG: MBL fold metallo-hydrolase [Nitrospira sp.]|nr:MBL fold metallo-hydrolase [Nitrospira sp.]